MAWRHGRTAVSPEVLARASTLRDVGVGYPETVRRASYAQPHRMQSWAGAEDMNTSRMLLCTAVLGLTVMMSACSPVPQRVEAGVDSPSPSAITTSSVLESLVPLDSSGRGVLANASIEPKTFGDSLPEDLVRRGWIIVNVSIPATVHGADAVLVVPMWYNASTSYVGQRGIAFPDTVVEAVKHPDWAWDAAGRTHLKFHLENGVLLLDEVDSSRD